jgi:hypothetical protein
VSAANTDPTQTGKEQSTLAPLFTDDAAKAFRSRWDDVQRGFVDDPQEAVQAGDELVAQVIKSLAESFSEQPSALEGELNQSLTQRQFPAAPGRRLFDEKPP